LLRSETSQAGKWTGTFSVFLFLLEIATAEGQFLFLLL